MAGGRLSLLLLLLLLAWARAGARAASSSSSSSSSPSCEAIAIPMCAGIGYNLTRMPNLLGHAAQGEASLALQAFAPLVSYGCHARLRFFLCSLFAPMCTEQVPRAAIPACRPLCEAARRRCSPVLAHFRFAWPPALDCARLPSRQDPHALCMEDPDGDDGDGEEGGEEREDELGRGMLPVAPPPPSPAPSDAAPPPCPGGGKFLFVPRLRACAARCSPDVDVLWSGADKGLAAAWMCAWAALCFASTAFAVLTFLLEPSRFRYPERPVVFLCVSYCAYASAFLLRGLLGAQRLSCAGAEGEGGGGAGAELLFRVPAGHAHAACAAAALLLYFSGMASALWWVVLALAWFLAAGKKWGHEAIGALGRYFHLAAWGLPLAQSAAALGLGAVAGDELTGLCLVGGASSGAGGVASSPGGVASSAWALVLAPLAGCLLAGTSFLLAGFAALFRIRRALKTGGSSDTHKLERLMRRLGLFSLLYALPAAAVVGCHLYEAAHAPRWRERALQHACAAAPPPPPPPPGLAPPSCRLPASIPAPGVFLLRIFMSLAVGVSSGAWVWSPKTLQAWQGLCRRGRGQHFRRKEPPAPVKQHGAPTRP